MQKTFEIYKFLYLKKRKYKKHQSLNMRSSSNGLKSAALKKKISISKNNSNTSQSSCAMNKTLASLSSTGSFKNQDKLSQLKQKLQKQRQSMRKSGRRFKDNGIGNNDNQKEIVLQTGPQEVQIIKPINMNNTLGKGVGINNKKSTNIGVSTTATSTLSHLYDFNSLKMQVENKTNKLFMKKNNSTKDTMVPVYTTKQILESVNGIPPSLVGKNLQTSSSGLTESKKSTQRQNKDVQSQRVLPMQQRKRQTVNLMELSAVIQKSPTKSSNNTSKQKQKQNSNSFVDPAKLKKPTTNAKSQQNSILANSQVFQSAIKEQKKRNKEIQQFLAQIGLQQFTQSFISMGFDQIQTLIEVQVDELNQMMMRARQQQRLMSHIKEYKLKNEIPLNTQTDKPLIDRPSAIKSQIGYRPKSSVRTQPSQSYEMSQNSRLRSSTTNFTNNTQMNLLNNSQITASNMENSTLKNKSSIFYMMGGNEWSLESQIRKACSGCFKVSYQGTKRGDCYYCDDCDPGQMDDFNVSLNQSMVRSYY